MLNNEGKAVMKHMKMYILAMMILGLVTVLTSSCAFNRVDLVKDGTVKLEVMPSEDEYITNAYVYREGDVLKVGGHVRSGKTVPMLKGGHVDVEIIGPDGQVLKECALYFPLIPDKQTRTSWFHADLQLNPSHGTVVRMIYHHTTSPEEILSPCK